MPHRLILPAIILTLTLLTIILINNQFPLTNKEISDSQITGNSIIASLHLEPEYYEVDAGDVIIVQLDILDIENDLGRKDIEIITSLIIPLEETIELSRQTMAIETQASKVLSVQLPRTLPKKEYTLMVEIRDSITGDTLAIVNQRIFVKQGLSLSPVEGNNPYYYAIAFFVAAVALLGIIIAITRKN